MRIRSTISAAGAVVVVLCLSTLARAAEPALTAAQQRKLQEASRLAAEAKRLYRAGRLSQAVEPAKKVLAIRQQVLGAKDPEVGVAMNDVAFFLGEQGEYAAAKPYYEQALAILKESLGSKHVETATAHNNLAYFFTKTGDSAAAKPHFEQALSIRKELFGPKHILTGQALNNLGSCLEALGELAPARQHFEQALAIRKAHDPKSRETGTTLNNLGALLLRQGDIAGARPLLEESVAVKKGLTGVDHETAKALNNLGAVLEAQGDTTSARANYEQALAIRKRVLDRKHPDIAESMSTLGSLLRRQGDYAAARPYLEQALAIRKEVQGHKHPDTSAALAHLGSLLFMVGDVAGARTHFEEALAINKSVLGLKHPDVAVCLNNLAVAQSNLGNHSAARENYTQALAIYKQVFGDNHPEFANGLHNFGVLEATAGDRAAAARYFGNSRKIIRRHVERVLPSLSEQEQLNFLRETDQPQLHDALSLPLGGDRDPQLCALSAEWLANSKAVSQEVLAQRERELLARDARLISQADADELRLARKELVRLAGAVPTAEKAANHQQLLEAASERVARAARKLSIAPGKTALEDPWIELPQLRKALPADGALIDLARIELSKFQTMGTGTKSGVAHYIAWIIRATGDVVVVDLGDATEIDKLVASSQSAIQAAVGGDGAESLIQSLGEPEAEAKLKQTLRTLAKQVCDPLLPHLADIRELVLSPDAALWLIPWAALPLEDGAYALERFEFRFLVSCRDLIHDTKTKLPTTSPTLFADPDFDSTPVDAKTPVQKQLAGAKGLPSRALALRFASRLPRAERLPGTAAEAKAIAPSIEQYAGKKVALFTEGRAGESAFKEVRSPGVLVLSTHGFFLPAAETQRLASDIRLANGLINKAFADKSRQPLNNPLLRCGLLLAGCNRRNDGGDASADDGVLTGMEILGVDLRGTELVVLSACQTGVGQVNNGEGVAGLRQAFQLAGAKSVVSTLWQIPDKQSAQLMTDFFGNLAAGQNKAKALRSAQLAMIKARRDRDDAAHPLFWAAWTVTGN